MDAAARARQRQRDFQTPDEDIVLGQQPLLGLDPELQPHVAEVPELARPDERERRAFLARAAGAAGRLHVDLRRLAPSS